MAEIRLHTYLRVSEGRLRAAGVDNPRLDAALLVGYGLGLDRAQLLSQSQRVLSDAEIGRADQLLIRRLAREPVARIMGLREFWSLNFALNEATLEPRPDSEVIVEAALMRIKRNHRDNERLRILDLGTGTGCLLIALLHELKNATGIGIDISARAVQQAVINAQDNDVASRSEFRVSNWFEHVEDMFDIILSNPPYIPHAQIEALDPEVSRHDPALALDGGADGLAPYRLVVPQLTSHLNPQGFALFEIGYNQADAVSGLFRKEGLTEMAVLRDYGGNDRCVVAAR